MEDGDSAEEEEAPARAGSAGRLPRVSSCEDAHTPPARAPRVSASAAPAAEEADALLKHRYRQYVCTQTLLTNLAGTVVFTLSPFTRGSTRALWSLAKALLLSTAVLAAFGAGGHLRSRSLSPRLQRALHPDTASLSLAIVDYVSICSLSLACLTETIVTLPQPGDAASAGLPTARAREYFSCGAHLAVATRWIVMQVPVRLVVLPELCRTLVCAVAALAYIAAWEPGGLTLATAAGIVLRALGAALLVPLLTALCNTAHVKLSYLPAALLYFPAPLVPGMQALLGFAERCRLALARSGSSEPLLDNHAVLAIHFGLGVLCYELDVTNAVLAARIHNIMIGTTLGAGILARLVGSSAPSLRALERRLGVRTLSGSRDGVARAQLATRLSGAASEHEVLRVAAEALHALFPGATAQACAALTDAGDVTILNVAAAHEQERRALESALPRALPLTADSGTDALTSVAFVCGTAVQYSTRGAVIADSLDWPAGVHAFRDWAAAHTSGCPASQFITARVASGVSTVGYVQLRFSTPSGFPGDRRAAHRALGELCETLGDALLARRAAVSAQACARALALASARAKDATTSGEEAALGVQPRELESWQARRSSGERTWNPASASAWELALVSPAWSPLRRSTPRVRSNSDLIAAAEAEATVAAAELDDATAALFLGQLGTSLAPCAMYVCGLAARGQTHGVAARAGVTACAGMAATAGWLRFAGGLPQLRGRAALPSSWPLVCIWLYTCLSICLDLTLLSDALEQCPAEQLRSACARRFFWLAHLPLLSVPWITAQLPTRTIFAPVLLRHAAFAAAALAVASSARELTLLYAMTVCIEGAAAALLLLLSLAAVCELPEGPAHLLADAHTCPLALLRGAAAVEAAGAALQQRLLRGAPLLDARTSIVLAAFSCCLLHRAFLAAERTSLAEACQLQLALLAAVLLSSHASKPRATTRALALALQSTAADQTAAMAQLRTRLAAARTEQDIMRAGCQAIAALFPGATVCALGAFAEGSGVDVISVLECSGGDDQARRALAKSLRAHASDPSSSVVRVCKATKDHAPNVLDSNDLGGGICDCADWAAACGPGGMQSAQAIAAPLRAGHVIVGFVQLHFGLYSQTMIKWSKHATLRELSETIGGAIFVHRAFAFSSAGFSSAAGLPSAGMAPGTPPVRSSHSRSRSSLVVCTEQPAAPFPGSEADAVALLALSGQAAADRATLESWSLDAWELEDAELQRLCSAALHSLGLLARFRISPTAFAGFVADVAAGYRDNPFHNWRHAFTVMHQCWLFLADDALGCHLLDDLECLTLLLAALCHDMGHPGTTNAFQVATCSALAVRYNDASVLENFHCAEGFAALERADFLTALSQSQHKRLRSLFVAAVLGTDMSVHKDLIARANARAAAWAEHATRSEPVVAASASLEDRQLLIACLLHAADLCNPLLPPAMSQRIVQQLSHEFARQAALERSAELPVTVLLAHDPVSTAKGEISFIDYVVQPLYATLAVFAPVVGKRCLGLIKGNRVMWSSIVDAAEAPQSD